jgi:hypothetical protein
MAAVPTSISNLRIASLRTWTSKAVPLAVRALLPAALALSCSDSSDSDSESEEVALTCGSPTDICYEYVGSYWTEGEVRDLCGATGQAGFRGTACPNEQRVGRCRYYPGAESDHQIVFVYYSPAFTAESAEADCSDLGANGAWSPLTEEFRRGPR